MDMNDLFYNEFNGMMWVLRSWHSAFNLMGDLRGFLPDKVLSRVPKGYVGDLVGIVGVEDKYYGKLNGSQGYVYTGVLRRRRVDSAGNFLKDSRGLLQYEDVVCPRGSIVVGFEGLSIGVPYRYEKEGYGYVDMMMIGGVLLYLYIVPRSVCVRVNQTALVLSYTKPRSYYSCAMVSLVTGHIMYVSVVPMDRRKWSSRNYRVIRFGAGLDYVSEVKDMVTHWVGQGLMYDPLICGLDIDVRGRTNMAYQGLSGGMVGYRKYDTKVLESYYSGGSEG